eukprot:s427_g15.t1
MPSSQTSGPAIIARFSNDIDLDATSSDEIGDGRLRCVAISDTHMLHWKIELPPGDVLIHCGDFTNNGTEEECRDFCDWAKSLPFPHKLLVCGNHDLPCDESWYREHWKECEEWHSEHQSSSEMYRMLRAAGFEVLHGTSCSIAGVKFYGSPIQPAQPSSRTQMAFGRMRGGQDLKEEWNKIPKDVDVLITHTPPHKIMDETQYAGKRKKHIGCEILRAVLYGPRAPAPAVHVFGHVHPGDSQPVLGFEKLHVPSGRFPTLSEHFCYGSLQEPKTLFINCASATDRRGQSASVNPPVTFVAGQRESKRGAGPDSDADRLSFDRWCRPKPWNIRRPMIYRSPPAAARRHRCPGSGSCSTPAELLLEIKRTSVVKIDELETFNALGVPIQGGLHSLEMGPTWDFNSSRTCETCGLHCKDCPGHLGHMEFHTPLFNPFMMNPLLKLLRQTCMACHKFKCHEEVTSALVETLQRLQPGELPAPLNLVTGKSAFLSDTGADVQATPFLVEELTEEGIKIAHESIRARSVKETPMEAPEDAATIEKIRAVVAQFAKDMPLSCVRCKVQPKWRREGFESFFVKPDKKSKEKT